MVAEPLAGPTIVLLAFLVATIVFWFARKGDTRAWWNDRLQWLGWLKTVAFAILIVTLVSLVVLGAFWLAEFVFSQF